MKVAERGSILVLALALVILLVSLAGSFLYAAGIFVLNSGWEEADAKLLCLAEAGLQKGIWNLQTPVSGGGQGEGWTTAGTTENLGDGSYTMVVSRYDFALSSNGSTASATSSGSGHPASDAIDNSNSTYWQSGSVPTPSNPQELTITLPYTMTLNKVRFVVPSGSSSNRPRRYSWDVSSDNVTYTTVFDHTNTNNSSLDVTDTFSVADNPAAAEVRYLRLHVERTGSGSARVRIRTLEAIGAKITSTGTIAATGQNYTRTVVQTVVADDGSPESGVSYVQPDWSES